MASFFLLGTTSSYAVTFDFSYTRNGVNAGGLLFATDLGSGIYLLTGISGNRNGLTITGLMDVGATGRNNDNLIYYGNVPATTAVDNKGFGYFVGSSSYQVFYSNSNSVYREDDGAAPSSSGTAKTITPTLQFHEPAPAPGLGLLPVLFLMGRKFASKLALGSRRLASLLMRRRRRVSQMA